MYLLRSVLEKDDLGKKFCENPEMFCKSPKKRARLLLCISEIMETIVRALDREYDRRTPRDDEQNKIGDFDYKNTLKTPKPSQEITEDVVEGYEGRCQYGDILPFSKLWDKRGRKKKKKVKK
jgi:hypothetical protein